MIFQVQGSARACACYRMLDCSLRIHGLNCGD